MEKMHHLDYESKRPSASALERYQDFMFNPANEYNCDVCPERGVNRNDCGLPCGQQNCWVSCHCGRVG